jgi:hypothetical protein
MSRIVLICSFAALLAASGTQSANAAQSAWGKESLACAAVGIDPGNPAFNKCVADLHRSLWAEKNLYGS